MINLKDYFDPVSIERHGLETLSGNAGFPHNTVIHTENTPISDFSRFKVALIGVPDGRNSPDAGSSEAPDAIRQQLYSLARIPGKTKIADLGNMKPGTSFADTIAGLADILTILVSANVFPVIIGGSSALVLARVTGGADVGRVRPDRVRARVTRPRGRRGRWQGSGSG